MRAIDLTDLQGKECVLLESGRGMIVRCIAFSEDGNRLYADLEISHPLIFVLSSVRLKGNWDGRLQNVGEPLRIFQPQDQVFRSPKAYVHFSSSTGGTRLLFLKEYVDKVRHKDANGWEWEDMIRTAREDEHSDGSSGAA